MKPNYNPFICCLIGFVLFHGCHHSPSTTADKTKSTICIDDPDEVTKRGTGFNDKCIRVELLDSKGLILRHQTIISKCEWIEISLDNEKTWSSSAILTNKRFGSLCFRLAISGQPKDALFGINLWASDRAGNGILGQSDEDILNDRPIFVPRMQNFGVPIK